VVKWTSVAPVKSIVKLPCTKSRWAIRFPYLLLPYLRKEQYLWVTGASAALESRISKHDNWVWRKRGVFLPLLSPAIRRAQTNLFLIISKHTANTLSKPDNRTVRSCQPGKTEGGQSSLSVRDYFFILGTYFHPGGGHANPVTIKCVEPLERSF